MKSKVTLYYKSLLNQDKNFVLDTLNGDKAIETYLSTLRSLSINAFQYVKQQLTLSIKVNMNQTNLEMVDSKDLNYVKIQNYDVVNETEVLEKACYYFVIGKNWRGKDTIEIVLSMDTINTLKFNSDYILNAKTFTKRMHKDRLIRSTSTLRVLSYQTTPEHPTTNEVNYAEEVGFRNDALGETRIFYGAYYRLRKTGAPAIIGYTFINLNEEFSKFIYENRESEEWYLEYIKNGEDYFFNTQTYIYSMSKTFQYIRKIDLKSEDISSPVYKVKEDILQESNNLIEWSLYYKNRDNQTNSPVDCYLIASQPIKFQTPASTRLIDVADIPVNNIILITPTYQGNLSFKINGSIYTLKSEEWQDAFERGISYSCIGFMNYNNTLRVYKYSFSRDYSSPTIQKIYEQSIDNAVVEFTGSADSINGYQDTSIGNYTNNFPATNFTFTFSSSTTITLNTKDSIDKTLLENLKIINIPYCPSDISFDGDIVSLPPLWTYDGTYHFLRLTDLNSKFSHTIKTNINDILSIFPLNISVDTQSSRFVKDSKLYHSDYYRPKFVYDSFSRVFPLEQINYGASIQNTNGQFKFTFVMSRNIVSKFLFKFDYVYDHSNEDYPNIVAVARNNEEVLYNSSYLNYIRTGYNYDLKSKERQETTGAIGLGLNIAGLIASLGVSLIPGGQAVGIGGAIASGLGLVGQMVNYAKTISQNEENIQRKLQETQRQAVSVLNADDYDLLYEYSQNKAKLCLYEVSDNMERVLDDIFYYGGYIINEQMIPTINSRYWFNFVQATLVINDSSNLSKEIEDDIKERFEQGVTFLHYHGRFDFEQNMENWETSLLD